MTKCSEKQLHDFSNYQWFYPRKTYAAYEQRRDGTRRHTKCGSGHCKGGLACWCHQNSQRNNGDPDQYHWNQLIYSWWSCSQKWKKQKPEHNSRLFAQCMVCYYPAIQLPMAYFMVMSSNGNVFRVAGALWGEFTGTGGFPHKGRWRGALMFSLICAWTNGWANDRDAGDLRRHRAHYDVTVMSFS